MYVKIGDQIVIKVGDFSRLAICNNNNDEIIAVDLQSERVEFALLDEDETMPELDQPHSLYEQEDEDIEVSFDDFMEELSIARDNGDENNA